MTLNICGTNTAFWALCFGTFFAIQIAALYYCKKIVSSRGEQLRREIQLAGDNIHFSKTACEGSNSMLATLSSELVTRGNSSLSLVATFTEYHYIALIAALASGTLGGIATFAISSIGWDKSTPALQGFFLGCAGSLSFWLTAIQVFKFQETIAKHEAIYTTCANLLSELRLAVQCPLKKDDTGKEFNMCEFLEKFAKKIESLRSIGISFDGSKIGLAKFDSPPQTR